MSVRDWLTLTGTVTVTAGAALVSVSLGLVVFGLILLYLGR